MSGRRPPKKASRVFVSLPGEEWRPIAGYRLYEVSNLGRVKATAASLKGEMLRTPRRKANGYTEVNLWDPDTGKYGFILIHKLVLEAFVSPRPEGCVACHQNGDRADNRLVNLRWDTQSANEADKARHGTRLLGERTNSAKLTAQKVREIRAAAATKSDRHHWGCTELARQYGVSLYTIKRVVTGEWWKHVR